MKNIANKVNDILFKNDLDYYCGNLVVDNIDGESYIVILNNGNITGAVWVEMPNEITDELLYSLAKYYTIIDDLNSFNVRYDPEEFNFETFINNTKVDDKLKFTTGNEWYTDIMKKYINQRINTITDFLINDKLN